VALGIEHGTGNTSATDEEHGTSNNEAYSPVGEQRLHDQSCLLSSVGEVVVSRAHVIESASQVHLDQTTIKVRGGGSIQLHAVENVLLGSIGVIVVSGQQLRLGQAASLVQHGHVLSQPLRLEHGGMVGQPLVSGRVRCLERLELHNVASVSLVSSLTSVSSRVGVATSPLEVNVVANGNEESLGNEVVFGSRVGLDDVSSFSSDVQVVDLLSAGYSVRSASNVEDVRSVLEGSAELVGVHGQLHGQASLVQDGVLEHRGGTSVRGPVNESLVRSVSVRSNVRSADVVSESQHAVAVILGDTAFP